ncbi:hypothetical protein ACLI44_001708 [Campylobacter upsaliensis]|uniref:DUF202 domain-containing protein n=1 Tax=Campylobacter upsaliensis TaxID=28080 RepID=A0A5L8ZB81_CAMUP|nr:hypothetical protein [Campylobacter jejuni]EAI5358445.1 hypothetical protein [Campylobacter upsaliensis]EAI6144017.1 hypothetical protein [Campylobacter upsaliensis]EAI7391407.1 hypothetical protein [Campylobacter upsaliensis]EAJ5221473.1 hypothetical protein [Campylobacter upsaliensis]
MSKLDKRKAELDDFKTWRNYAITSLIALIAFIFTQNNKSNTWILVISFLAIFVLGIAIIYLQTKIKKIINDLEEL